MVIEDERDIDDGQRRYEYKGASEPPDVFLDNSHITKMHSTFIWTTSLRFETHNFIISYKKILWIIYGTTTGIISHYNGFMLMYACMNMCFVFGCTKLCSTYDLILY